MQTKPRQADSLLYSDELKFVVRSIRAVWDQRGVWAITGHKLKFVRQYL